ncbi:MAG: S8 family serine peptidase [Lachnospiraceae bacterium]|nr:S8 family serine peptidase [Lachnospiraceae bacterium]
MANQKIENQLNLSLEATPQEREKSLELDVGYDAIDRTWELIVKYHGDITGLANELIQVELLINGYAIVTLPESLVESFANLEEIEYIEKPKRLFFQVYQGKIASCILPVTIQEPNLTGRGVIVAVIDSGIAYEHMDFRNADGTSRILELWDQSIPPDPQRNFNPPEGFAQGTVFNRQQINAALAQPVRTEMLQLVPSIDQSGHGTQVAGIAAGNGTMQNGRYQGVAPESELMIVKLGTGRTDGFPRTTELMRALTYVVNRSIHYGRPVSVNVSFGNTYGAHDGTSLLERFMDNVAEIGRTVISVGSGNEGAAGGHVAGSLLGYGESGYSSRGGTATGVGTVTGGGTATQSGKEQRVELAVANYERGLNVQLWKHYNDRFSLTIQAPDNSRVLVPLDRMGKQTMQIMNTQLLIYVGEPTPYSTNQEIYIDFIPVNQYIDNGVWTFIMTPERIVTGEYYYYLPSENILNVTTRFYQPTPEVTLTIPSTAEKVITVGAYNTVFDAYADFSGRGYVENRYAVLDTSGDSVKPDIVAPGVNITTTSRDGGYTSVTGTSFATPFVTGSAALLLEWGIVRGNDPFLYGEKVKAYLIRGARQLPGMESPNAMTGWGALCVRDSLPL